MTSFTRSRSFEIAGALALVGILSLGVRSAKAASTSLAFQGFETNTGDWTDITGVPGAGIARVPSGGGVLGLPSAAGAYHAEITNEHDTYLPGFGFGDYSFFGFASQPPYTGDFSQSVSMYVNVNWATATFDGPGVWIDMQPGNPDPNNSGAEHNFRLTPSGSSVAVTVDGQTTPIVTITTSGWYQFQMTYQKGTSPTALVTTVMKVFDNSPAPNLLGATTVLSDSVSTDGPLLSENLLGPGYVWITVWADNFANDVLAIDNARADLLAVCDGISGSFNGNLTVSSGETCVLNGSTISGNVTQSGGSIIANGAVITGNLQTSGGGTFSLNASKIDGNLQIQNIPAGAGSSQVCGTTVGGGLQFHNNGTAVLIGSAGSPPCAGNIVAGDLQVQNNTAAVQIVGNSVGGNLQVSNNTGPTQVFNNNVTKNLQCQNNTNLNPAGPNMAGQKQGCF